MATKAEMAAELAEIKAALASASGETPKPESKVTMLPGFDPIPETNLAIGVDGSFRTHVAIVSLNADGAVKMSKAKPGSPYKPCRIPVAAAEYLSENPDVLASLAESCRTNAAE